MTNFLDDHPQDWQANPEYGELLEILIAIAEDSGGLDFLRTLASQAGIASGAFPAYPRVRATCEALIREMGLQGKLRTLVKAAGALDTRYAGRLAEMLTLPRGIHTPDGTGQPDLTKPRLPGALPPIWNVPFHRNLNFTGRAAVLGKLRADLTSGDPNARIQALTGLGGMGKTQLALEYAYRHSDEYNLVWWLRAEEPAVLAADYAQLAGPLGLPEAEAAEQAQAMAAACHWLASNDGWLLIFDDAGDRQSLHGLLPQGATGHILITSRNAAWRGTARSRGITPLKRTESVAFLQQRIGQEDEAAASDLAAELGDLPLALEQASAYIDESGIPFADYLTLFRDRHAELWAEESEPEDYPATVAATWSLSMERAAAESPAAAGLLNLCAYLAPEEIPRDLVARAGEWAPGSLAPALEDPLHLNKAVAALRRYSLLDVTGETWSLHRLVGAVVRDRLQEAADPTWAIVAAEMLNSAFPSNIQQELDTWPVCQRLLPHALAAAGHAEAFEVALEEAAYLFNQAGQYLETRAAYGEARDLYERALKIDEATFGPDHPNVARDVDNLGCVLRALGDLPAARQHFERALQIDQGVFGPDHLNVAMHVNNLGSVLKALGDLPAARGHFERALEIDEATVDSDHPELAIHLSNLGLLLLDLGDLPAARGHLERALEIFRAAHGDSHPHVATATSNLGGVLKDLGDLPAARGHFERALAIDEATLGPDHPNVAIRLSNLGGVLQALGDLPAARQNYERALAIDQAAFGPDHPEVATDLGNLGGVLQDLRDLPAARGHFERALEIFREAYGDSHTQVATAYNNLGSVLRDLGDLPAARQHYQRALEIDQAAFGPDHPNVAIRLNNLGTLLQDLGDLPAARQHYQRALAIREKALGKQHPDTATTTWWLGILDEQEGNLQGARDRYEQALAVYEAHLPEDHPTVRNIRGYAERVRRQLAQNG